MAINQLCEDLKKKFDDGDVDSPLDFKHVVQLQFLMSTIGCWPHGLFGRHRLNAIMSAFNLLLFVMTFTLIILSAAYIWEKRETISFFDSGHNVLCMTLVTLLSHRLLLARMDKYQETIKDYLFEFHLFYFKDRSPYAAKVHGQVLIISGMFTLYVMCQLVSGLFLFMFMPWYNNYSRGMFGERPENSTFEHSEYYYLPDAAYTTKKGYWMLFAFNVPTSYVTTAGLSAFDLLLCLIVFQIWGHIKILKHNISSLPLPVNSSSGMYSAEENRQVRMLLKEIVVNHNLIVKFVNRCSDAFNEYLFIFYLLMQLISVIVLLEVTSFTADSLAKYGPLTLAMHQQLIQVSMLFEMINTKSTQLIDAAYAMPWEVMDPSNRKMVLFFLARVQRPVSLKAAKIVPVGVQTMSAILKTSFTYYMMLNAVAGER